MHELKNAENIMCELSKKLLISYCDFSTMELNWLSSEIYHAHHFITSKSQLLMKAGAKPLLRKW